MFDKVLVETRDGEIEVSVDTINRVSEYLIAKVDTEAELGDLIVSSLNEQDAKKEAWKLAYKEVPVPGGILPLQARIEIAERRNELAQKYFNQLMHK